MSQDNPDSTDDQLNQQNKNQISGESTGTGSSAPIAGGGSSTAAPTQEQRSSGSFTNLNQYVEANKDQAQGLGNKVEQNVQGAANQGLSQLNNAQQNFNTQEQAAGVNPNDYSTDKVTNVGNAIINSGGAAQSDIDSFKQAQASNAAFQAGTDTAPKALTDSTDYQTAKSSLDNAAQNAQLTGTESGRNTLLRQTFQRPDYSQGQTSLDQLLTQNSPENRQTFQNLRDSLLGQYGLANQETQAVQNAADERQNVIQGTQQSVNNIQNVLYGPQTTDGTTSSPGILTAYLQQIAAQPANIGTQQQAQLTATQKQLADALQSGGLANIISKYNPSTANGTSLSDFVQNYLSEQTPSNNVTLQNTLTAPEIASLQQIGKLQSDANGNINVGGQSINPNELTPGTVSTSPNVNAQGLTGAIQNSLNAYGNTVKTNISNGLNNTINTYGSTKTLSQAANDALNLLNTGMTNPTYDATQTSQVASQFKSQIDSLNQTRTQAGLSPIPAPDVDKYQSQIINSMLNSSPDLKSHQLLKAYESGNTSVTNDPYFKGVLANINNAAQIQAYNDILNTYKNDPLTGTNYSNFTNPNYITNLIKGQSQNQSSNVINPQPAPTSIEGKGTGTGHTVS